MSKFKDIFLGRNPDGGKVCLSHGQRMKHMLTMGKSGLGKSKFLEHLIRQDISEPSKPGLILIDPHGELYDDIVAYCAYIGTPRKVHLINPSDLRYTPGYNPLHSSSASSDVLAKMMMQGVCQVFGQDSMAQPLTRETLVAVFYVLIENNCTLAEANLLMGLKDEYNIREYLTQNLEEKGIQQKWQNFIESANNPRTRTDFLQQMGSADRRIFEFNLSPLFRRIFGRTENTLDISECMYNGDIVLVNLSTEGNNIDEEGARLLGTLLLRDVYISAKARDKTYGKEHPFYVYVDECYDYLTSDVEKMLDQTRKYGVHLILACQRLGQLRAKGDEIYNSVLTGTETKVIFGGLSQEDVLNMAGEIYMTEIDLERGVDATKNPMVVGQRRTWMKSSSSSKGGSSTDSESTSSGVVVGGAVGISVNEDGEITSVDTDSNSTTEGSGSSSSQTSSQSETKGKSETFESVYEDRHSSTWPIDKLLWEKASYLKQLPERQAVAYTHNSGATPIEIPFVKDVPNRKDSELPQFYIQQNVRESAILTPQLEAAQIVEDRFESLKLLAGGEIIDLSDDELDN